MRCFVNNITFVQLGSNTGDDEFRRYLIENNIEISYGVLVEPFTVHIETLRENYFSVSDNVVIENVAIKISDDTSDHLEFFYHTKDGPGYEITSTLKSHIEKHVATCRHLAGGEILSFTVPCISLEELLISHKLQKLDWLLIDIEGMDADLILNFDWKSFDITKVEFEWLHLGNKTQKLVSLLEGMGYIKCESLHRNNWCFTKG